MPQTPSSALPGHIEYSMTKACSCIIHDMVMTSVPTALHHIDAPNKEKKEDTFVFKKVQVLQLEPIWTVDLKSL